ncbi:MAG: UbiD family decarboxylase [Dehalococcoidia bacterium]
MFNDLREFVHHYGETGECQVIEGAHWDLEIGAITEWQASLPDSPILLFDAIQGYPKGFRVATNLYTSHRRAAVALGLPAEASKLEHVRMWRELEGRLKPMPPVEVESGPVLENVLSGEDVDLLKFPVPRWHEKDGGRYIGTGSMVITRDPEEGWVNLGTERIQVHSRDTATVYLSPGRHTDLIRKKYWAQGKPCPVAIVCGQDPMLWAASNFPVPWGTSEYDYAGALRGEPVEVVKGPYTGLPIPARAEIVLEGEILPPDMEPAIQEGPFGEWTGYYHPSGTQPPIKVRTVLHRNDPILQGTPPLLTPLDYALGRHIRRSAVVWDLLDREVPGIKGVWMMEGGTPYAGLIISIEQQWNGHALHAALKVLGSYSTAYMLRWIFMVDGDIDPTDWIQVSWALNTRCDPKESIQIIDGCWGGPVDPRLPPEKRERGDFTHSCAIVLACRPFHWRDRYPSTIISSPEAMERIKQKWAKALD